MGTKYTIKQWRLIKGLTQKQLANMIGMSFTTYQAKEAGKRSWRAEDIKNIARVLGLSIDQQLEY